MGVGEPIPTLRALGEQLEIQDQSRPLLQTWPRETPKMLCASFSHSVLPGALPSQEDGTQRGTGQLLTPLWKHLATSSLYS